jgi:23S rRNA (cytidine1920-2'-O)/16S rRNA (cytidine1409-2'-O)-methyltransferase
MASRRRQPFIPIAHALRARFPDQPDDVLANHCVLVDGRLITNPNAQVRRDASIRLLPARRLRGDIKLAAALDALAVESTGVIAVDVGAAAGGFTTALLRAGARRVYAVDTGYGQLRGSLRADPRVVSLERTNVDALRSDVVSDVVDVVTMDLSYTSIAAAIESLDALRLAVGARLIALVKPTFELSAGRVVLDRARVDAAIALASEAIEAAGWRCDAITLPRASGRHGAVEAFVLASGPRPVGE